MTNEEKAVLDAAIKWQSPGRKNDLVMRALLVDATDALIKSRKPDPVMAFVGAATMIDTLCDFPVANDCLASNERCTCRRTIQAGLDAANEAA